MAINIKNRLVEELVVTARGGEPAVVLLHRFLELFGISTVPFGAEHWQEAVAAYQAYGKGRHPAALNFGDCLTYATAALSGLPLLCVGNDLSATDLQLA